MRNLVSNSFLHPAVLDISEFGVQALRVQCRSFQASAAGEMQLNLHLVSNPSLEAVEEEIPGQCGRRDAAEGHLLPGAESLT